MDYMPVLYITILTSVAVSVSIATFISRFLGFSRDLVRRIFQISLVIMLILTLYQMYALYQSGYAVALLSGFRLLSPDNVSLIAVLGILLGGFIALSSYPYERGAYEIVLAVSLLGILGSVLVSMAVDFITLIVLWTLISLASYSVIALARDPESLDASSRYIIVGVLASQFLLLGVGLLIIYLRSLPGSFYISSDVSRVLPLISLAFILGALGFKLGSAPFHFWIPDVYGRASPYAIAMIAGSIKLGLVVFLARLVLGFKGYDPLFYMIALLSILSMIIGSITPLTQGNIQRILAFSSVNHIGFILIGVSVLSLSIPPSGYYIYSLAMAGISLHILSYAMSKSSLFSLVGFIRSSTGSPELSVISKNLQSSPELRFSAVLHLANLIGVPPLPGFWSKLFIFLSAAYSDPRLYIAGVPWLVVMGVIASVFSVFYYLNIIRALYLERSSESNGGGSLSRDVFYPYIASILLIIIGSVIPVILVFMGFL
ncbi:MAG: proton-conducting transporter membrane subunit [Sulfolobales archaeon]